MVLRYDELEIGYRRLRVTWTDSYVRGRGGAQSAKELSPPVSERGQLLSNYITFFPLVSSGFIVSQSLNVLFTSSLLDQVFAMKVEYFHQTLRSDVFGE